MSGAMAALLCTNCIDVRRRDSLDVGMLTAPLAVGYILMNSMWFLGLE